GTNTTPPAQLLLLENLDTDEALPAGIKIQAAAGGITNALDLSDVDIVNALSLGANDITSTHFTLTGSNGNISTDGTFTAGGNINANSGPIATTKTTGNLFNKEDTT